MSRAIGDADYKGDTLRSRTDWLWPYGIEPRPFTADLILSEPSIEETTLTEDDQFFVMACDGLFDVMNGDEVSWFVLSIYLTNS